MKFLVTVDRDEDGVWVAECPAIPGCVSQGDSREEAVESIRETIVLCLEVRAERGLPLTRETRQIEVAMETPPRPALSGREVVRVFVAKSTPRSLIRAANVTVEELLAVRWTRSRPATAPDPRDRSRQRSR